MGSPDVILETPEGEIFIDLKTVQVKGGKTIKLIVRNVFYRGFFGKIKTIWFWLRYNRDKTFKEYLDSPVKYIVEMGELNSYHSIDAEAELTAMLEEEIKKKLDV